jgi:hypothetical protein
MRRLALAATLLLSLGLVLAQDAGAPVTPSPLLPPPARNNATVTACGACCAPGGSCDNAFKGAPFRADARARARVRGARVRCNNNVRACAVCASPLTAACSLRMRCCAPRTRARARADVPGCNMRACGAARRARARARAGVHGCNIHACVRRRARHDAHACARARADVHGCKMRARVRRRVRHVASCRTPHARVCLCLC